LEVAKQIWKAMQPWRAQFFLEPPPKKQYELRFTISRVGRKEAQHEFFFTVNKTRRLADGSKGQTAEEIMIG
jgi:hypothetical protein